MRTSRCLKIDFASAKMQYRRTHTSLKKEMLARALGLKKNSSDIIVDATAGLARDSFILASLGFSIVLIERSPMIHALLQDGITRAMQDATLSPIVKRLTLIQGDAIAWLKQAEPPALIYLDPMFPEKKKSSLVKKEMQLLQEILGEDHDADQLLETALACATKRVVVKRPRLALPLGGKIPTFELKGSSSRFDIYLPSPLGERGRGEG